MRNRNWSRRGVLKTTTALAAGALFAEPLRAAPPPPTSVTPALVEAARKEGKLSYYSALELNVGERLAKAFEAKYQGISVRVERSGAERIFQRIAQEQASASTPSTSPTAPTPPIIWTGRARTGWRPMFPTMSRSISRRIRSIPMDCTQPRAAGSKPSATTPVW